MGRKQKYEGAAKRVTIQLPLSTIEYYEGLAGTLADGIVAGETILRGEVVPERNVRGDAPEPEIPAMIPSKLPPIYKGSEDVTPRFKEKITRGTELRARRSADSQIPDVDEGDVPQDAPADF